MGAKAKGSWDLNAFPSEILIVVVNGAIVKMAYWEKGSVSPYLVCNHIAFY